MPGVDSRPFFFRSKTIDVIREIASQEVVTIYAGAGVTIDKSGLTWTALVDHLLRRYIDDADTRQSFISEYGPLFAASAAHQYFRNNAPESGDQEADIRQRIAEVLGVALYQSGGWEFGQLVPSIADALMVWNAPDSHGKRIGEARLATTNYDDYIYIGLREAFAAVDNGTATHPEPGILFPTVADPLLDDQAVTELAPWVVSGYFDKNILPCIHLHGRIPRDGYSAPPSQRRFPVVSEKDYYLTAEPSRHALKSLLTSSNLILVGTSLSDPPLLRALEETKDQCRRAGLRRWALMVSKHPGETARQQIDYQELVTNRLKALGVIPIYVDWYSQLAQFFREISIHRAAFIRTATDKRDDGHFPVNVEYKARLRKWWKAWYRDRSENKRYALQLDHHFDLLNAVTPTIRKVLDPAPEENFKIEIWVRWDPANTRKMRLWTSNQTTWTDEQTMREVDISSDSETLAVDTFRSGRPSSGPSDQRRGYNKWKSYLAMPCWYVDHHAGNTFVSGVVVMASDKTDEDSSLGKYADKQKLRTLYRYLQFFGSYVVET